jgi:hypothetical protein
MRDGLSPLLYPANRHPASAGWETNSTLERIASRSSNSVRLPSVRDDASIIPQVLGMLEEKFLLPLGRDSGKRRDSRGWRRGFREMPAHSGGMKYRFEAETRERQSLGGSPSVSPLRGDPPPPLALQVREARRRFGCLHLSRSDWGTSRSEGPEGRDRDAFVARRRGLSAAGCFTCGRGYSIASLFSPLSLT